MKNRGTLCAVDPKGVTDVSRMPEKQIFYKNAGTKKLKAKSLARFV